MVALGPLVDSMNDVQIQLAADPMLPMSQDRADAWNFAMAAYYCVAFALVIGSIIWAIIEYVAWHSGPAW
jgi:hypothetical protein